MMKLTRRQEEFIQKMFEAKRESAGPIHYSKIAEHLGVSPFTAYDMLCLLEKKGYVTSEYKLRADKSGPGRAVRVFHLSAMAQAQHQRSPKQSGNPFMDNNFLKAFALETLANGVMTEQDLKDQMKMLCLPGRDRELRYCVDVMTLAAQILIQFYGQQVKLNLLLKNTPGESRSWKVNLCLLGGYVYASLTQQCEPNSEWLHILQKHLQKYVDIVIKMTSEDCKWLVGELDDIFTALVELQEEWI